MDVGTTFEIEYEGSTTRLTSELTGKEDGSYLIVKWPDSYSMANDSNIIFKDNNVYVKYLYKGVEFGFQSRILKVLSDPAKLIFIGFPKSVDVCVLRENRRIDCFLPANLRIADNIVDGNVTDLSRGGCQFIAETSDIEKSIGILETGNEIDLSFQLPGVEKEVTLTAKQRNIKKAGNNMNIGFEFISMSVEVQEKLDVFLTKAGA